MGRAVQLIDLSGEVLRGSDDDTAQLLGVVVSVVSALASPAPNSSADASARARAAEAFLSEAHRRFRANPQDDGWRTDLRLAREKLIEARAWQQEQRIDDGRRARTEFFLAAVSAPLLDEDGVDHWLRETARTLGLRADGDILATLRLELPRLGEETLLGPDAYLLRPTEAETSSTSAWERFWYRVEETLETRLERTPEDYTSIDPRTDPIGWG